MQRTDTDIDLRLRGRTFVVGVGVQKAGTTWLYEYLATHPDVCMSEKKEMHYFDVRFDARPSQLADQTLRRLQRRLNRLFDKVGESGKVEYTERIKELLDLARVQYDDEGYAGYFARRVGDHKLFGEITPAYALIGEEGFTYMRNLFPRRKVIYLMRDPVDRHYSMMRMQEEKRERPGMAIRDFITGLDESFNSRTADYPTHIQALRSVFPEEDLFFGFYETLFTEAEVRRLCAFLDIPFRPANYDERVNTSSTKSALDESLIAQARERLAPVYDYCRKTFPDLPASWRA